IARTDTMAPWSLKSDADRAAKENEAFERAVAYAEAGADVIMPLYASMDWLKRFGNRIPKPLLVLSSEYSTKDLEPYNVKVVVYSTNVLAKTFGLVREMYAEWLAAGKSHMSEQDLKDRQAAHVLNGLLEKEKIFEKYGE